jgi:hypothetical protein
MGKKRRPSKPSNIIHGSSNNYDPTSNNGPSINASMNGISLPPAVANQILAAMARSSANPPMSTNSGSIHVSSSSSPPMNMNGPLDAASKQYLDEMGRMIAAHMNNANFGGSVRFTGSSSANVEGKAVYGPALPPPSMSMEFNNWHHPASTTNRGATTNNPNSIPIDTANFQNIQQIFGMNNNAGSFGFASSKNVKTRQYNTQNPEDIKTMMSLFTELMGMSSTTDTTSPTNEELAREFYEKFIASDSSSKQSAMLSNTDPVALRKAAFAAGVNVAMQQSMRREEMNNSESSRGEGGKKGGNPCTAGGKVESGGNNNNNSVPVQKVFSMIFGENPPSSQGGGSNIPPIPPPPNGWPSNAPAAAAAAAAFASSLPLKGNTADSSNSNNPNMHHSTSQQPPPNNHPYYNSEFAFSPADLGSPAWLEYYFEEYAKSQQAQASSLRNNYKPPQDRPDPPSKTDHPPTFEYTDNDEARLLEERRIILEAEEKERKAQQAAKKKDKKARKKERAKKEAETKAAAALKKKREKAITSWRSRIVAACTAGDASKMEVLLSESPYKNYVYNPDEEYEEDEEGYIPQSQTEYLIRQLDWFLPNVLQKYNVEALGKIPFENNKARELLAKYIMNVSFDTVCIPGMNMLRNALHTAAYYNDVDFVRWIIEGKEKEGAKYSCEEENPYSDCLDALCDDAGWTPLHYAVAAGSVGVVEMLLEAGCNIRGRSDNELTCLMR